jgi:nitric oxide synthase-interacting protein
MCTALSRRPRSHVSLAQSECAAASAGQKVRAKDVIKLVGGGTGFAGKEGQRLQSDKKYTLGPGSGMADLRGQASSGTSRFGLSFQN